MKRSLDSMEVGFNTKIHLSSAAILAAIRNGSTFSKRLQKTLPILGQLLSRVREGTFKCFSLAILLDSQRYVSGQVSLDVKLELAKTGWDTGIYYLRLAGTDLIHSMHREAEVEGTQRLDQIREVLESSTRTIYSSIACVWKCSPRMRASNLPFLQEQLWRR